MLFLVDNKNKIIFCYSAKCGSSHIKNIFWFLQTDNIDINIRDYKNSNPLPNNIKNYTTLIIIRNPYKRIISGFLDKYKETGQYRHLWKNDKLTFSMFVNELEKNNWEIIDKHHFTPQTTENFKLTILQSKTIKFFDIENIDYKYIEKLYNKKIAKEVINKKMGNARKEYEKTINDYVYDLHIDDYLENNIDLKYFYNEEIKNKIFKFYENDFVFLKNNGFDYTNFL